MFKKKTPKKEKIDEFYKGHPLMGVYKNGNSYKISFVKDTDNYYNVNINNEVLVNFKSYDDALDFVLKS